MSLKVLLGSMRTSAIALTFFCAGRAALGRAVSARDLAFGSAIGASAVLILNILVELLPRLFRGQENLCPPSEARFLIELFMADSSGDALLGDLDERFYRIAREYSPGRARFWYWFQVIISLRPLAWECMKRLTGAAAAYEAIRKVLK